MKILFILPPSIAGELIIKGFASGFKALGHEVLTSDVRVLESEIISKFQPDFAFGYCYAHFICTQAFDAVTNAQIQVIHYFADEPFSNFAHSGDFDIVKNLKASNPIVFVWDKKFVGAFGANTNYLPLGVDLSSYNVTENEYRYDISFVGRPLTKKRQTILADIIKNFPTQLNIFCFEKHFERSVIELEQSGLLTQFELENYKKAYKGFLKSEQEIAEVYNASKINLNITEQGSGSLNYRVFEVLASQGFLVTDDMSELEDYFVINEDLVVYKTPTEAVSLVRKYLNEIQKRLEISNNGYKKVKSSHSFEKRVESILKFLK